MAKLTKDQVKDYIAVRLGGTSVDVDLEEQDYEEIIKGGLRALGTFMPVDRYGLLHISAGQQHYTLDMDTFGRGIRKIQRPYPSSLLYTMWPLPTPYIISVPLRFVGDYALTMTLQKEAEHLFGADFAWEFDRLTGSLLIKPPPIQAGNYVYIYFDDPLLEEITGRQQWFLDHCLAEAKMIVGSKYRKFASFPGTDNTVELLKDLYQEGSDARTTLMEKLEAASLSRTVPIGTYRQG